MGKSSARRSRPPKLRLVVAAALALALTGAAFPVGASRSEPAPPDGSAQATPTPVPTDRPEEVPPAARSKALGDGWQASEDRAVTAVATAQGYTVLAAREKQGYAWTTVATLSRPGIDTDTWVGNMCLTADAKRAVVVYGPRTAANNEPAMGQGGFAAIVDLDSGAVRDLPHRYTLAYFNPGCGVGQKVALTSYSADGRTRIVQVDASSGAVEDTQTVAGQLTSAVPTSAGIVAAGTNALVKVDGQHVSKLRAAGGTPYNLVARAGSLAYVDDSNASAVAHLLTGNGLTAETVVATGAKTAFGLQRDGRGRLVLTGTAKVRTKDVAAMKTSKRGDRISSHSRLVVAPPVARADEADGTSSLVSIEADSQATGRALSFTHATADDVSATQTPRAQKLTVTAGSPTDPLEPERACAVPRNDPHNQALQPKPRQVEWTIDQAIFGNLPVSRPANWKNLGMPAYSPQGLFPLPAISGGGSGRIPAQILLGIAAQESNLWQASRYTTPGVTGNPLVGNYYGNDSTSENDDFWTVDWNSADCGYGVMQITDGMRRPEMVRSGDAPSLPYDKQRAIALDFTANIAAGAQLLATKWNQTRAAGLTINNGDPDYLENWFFAVWAYNTGFYPQSGGEPWGVGWFNNPVNPIWDPGRTAFLDGDPSDAAHPSDWPYPEKVLGFAANALELPESDTSIVPAFRTAWWADTDGHGGTINRTRVKPPKELFCVATVNDCHPGVSQQPSDPEDLPGPCLHQNAQGQYDLRCYYHGNATWKPDCDETCGQELVRFDPRDDETYPYQADATSFPPNCTRSGLPAGALIVDDVPSGTAPVLDGSGRPCSPVSTTGAFSLSFTGKADGTVPSKMDLHQLGAGFNDHFYFSHTYASPSPVRITGTWTLGQSLNQWTRVLVHMPDHAGWTNQALYAINNGAGAVEHRSLLQRNFANTWVSLGVFDMHGVPSVSLANSTTDPKAEGKTDIAWDAVAFQPLPTKPRDFYVALGDSYSSGEGASAADGSDFSRATDHGGPDDSPTHDHANNCHRSTQAWPRKADINGSGVSVGQRADSYDSTLDFQFVACSGAETRHMLPYLTASGPVPVDGSGHDGREPQNGMLTQLDSGFLDANTTLVSFSIGGNDIKFGPVFQACIEAFVELGNCASYTLPNELEGVETATKRRATQEVPTSIEVILGQIRSRAPNAKIVLMGYPKIFAAGSTCVMVGDNQRPWLNEVADDLNASLQQGVTAFTTAHPGGPAVTFANPVTAFAGRTLCTTDTAINALIFDLTPGDRPQITIPAGGPNGGLGVSMQSFHPNKKGTTLYSNVFTQSLQSIGYRP
ncbi:GDSL-type esterase/lipase family protein [uncultured Leifsonia sp.]|uniref:GDSL-type esterase/lipase family protein n=1 Tax=uncultured Leifsonia sp. TaxID=340359 RepID=UPI0028D8D31F|nr:GDSL-type esterase/lipase family protein [uncultured Leifsonia sp.]